MNSHNLNMAVFMAIIASVSFCSLATTKQYMVGEATGWVIPNPSDSNFYAEWASNKIFTVGDCLVFEFLTGSTDVTEVCKDDYDHCYVSDRKFTLTTGPTIFKLTTPGMHYYISSLEGHCQFNQKLAINVVPANTTCP